MAQVPVLVGLGLGNRAVAETPAYSHDATREDGDDSRVVRAQLPLPDTPAPISQSTAARSPTPDGATSRHRAEIWFRVRERLGLPDHANHPLVQRHLDWHRNNPDFIERVSRRAKPFLFFILKELESRNMPSELALLPAVESAYLPFAYSSGRAAGIWQFTPLTGRAFGLKQNWWYDGRRDIYASTHAALEYLSKLHRQFDGDWLLALAAYNSGAGRVRSAMNENARRGRPTDYWNLKLPDETRYYVPRLLALRALVSFPSKYGARLPPLLDEPYIDVVEIDGQIDLSLAAELADLTLGQLYELNPGFNRWATDPTGPHRLLLPRDRKQRFLAGLEQTPPERRVTWVRHKIASGETLSHIANEYHTTVAALKQTNKLSDSRIRAGHYLIVPKSRKPPEQYTLTAPERRKRHQNRPSAGKRTVHVVGPGDTFWDIARDYNVAVRKITRWNGMAPGDPLRPGDKLVLWVPDSASQVALTPRYDASPVLADHALRKIRYSVRKGDSLAAIAQRFKVSISDIRRWNNIDQSSHVIRPGQALELFIDVTKQGVEG